MGRVISGRGRPNISAAKPAYLNQNSRPRCSATAAASSAFGLRQRGSSSAEPQSSSTEKSSSGSALSPAQA